MTGSARIAQEALENAEVLNRKKNIERKKREIERKRKALDAKIESLLSELESEESETIKLIEREQEIIKQMEQDKIEMAESRKADIKNITINKH